MCDLSSAAHRRTITSLSPAGYTISDAGQEHQHCTFVSSQTIKYSYALYLNETISKPRSEIKG